MDKIELINDICFELSDLLTKELQEKLKIAFLIKMEGYELTETKMLPCIETKDNEWILKRYVIDSLASDRKESTVKAYIGAVKELFNYTNKNYSQITSQDITDFLAIKQHTHKMSQNYKSTLYRYFSAFFKWAFTQGHIENNIMDKVPHVKPVKKKKERLTDEEIEDMRESCQTLKEKALFELLIGTGMRVGEVVKLNITDVDFNSDRINIYGEKTNTYRTGMLNTKSKKALKKYIESRTVKSEALFISDRSPYNRLQKSSIEKCIKDLAVRAGITRIKVTVHVIRKTFASIMYQKTNDILFVSKMMGHAKTDMTVEYYLIDDLENMQYKYNIAN